MMTGLIAIASTILLIFPAPASAFDSSFPDNTVYTIYEFESGFHGPDPYGGWGANDQLFAVKETLTFMADGSFSATINFDDEVTRNIGDDVATGNNKFTTTLNEDSGSGSGTYTVSADGVVTINYDGDDSLSGALSADGQTIIFGYNDFDDGSKYSSFGIGIGVKRIVQQRGGHTAGILFLLGE